MRSIVNLTIAAGLAATAFAGLAAEGAAASACENPDGLAIVTVDEAFTHDYSGQVTTPMGGIVGGEVASVDFLVDTGDSSRKVNVKATWTDGVSDYDLRIFADGVEVARPFETDSARESGMVKLEGCVAVTVELENFVADPTSPVKLTVEIAG